MADTWPAFSRVALDRGFQAVHATPVRLRDRIIGSLCLFSTEVGALSDRDAAVVQTLADAATIVVTQQHLVSHHENLNAQLEHALHTCIVIEQAKGVLAQRLGVSVDAAFGVMRQRSRSTNTKLQDITMS